MQSDTLRGLRWVVSEARGDGARACSVVAWSDDIPAAGPRHTATQCKYFCEISLEGLESALSIMGEGHVDMSHVRGTIALENDPPGRQLIPSRAPIFHVHQSDLQRELSASLHLVHTDAHI